MYLNYDIKPLLKEAEVSVLENDRMQYAKYFKAAEYYLYENELILGGRTSMEMLLGHPLTKDLFYYEIYGRNIEDHSKKLADIFCKIDGNMYITRDVNIVGKEYSIEINTRRLFYFYSLDNKQGYDIKTMIAPKPIKGYFGGKEVLCMNPKLHLINIYQQMYKPYSSDTRLTYTELVDYEKQLNEKAALGLHDITSPDIMMSPNVDKTAGSSEASHYWKIKAISNIMSILAENKNNIFIGDTVIQKDKKSRFQILSSENIDTVVNLIRSNLSELNPSVLVTYRYHLLYMPNDFQLMKYTVYATDPSGDRQSLMDIFNSTVYELVSTRQGIVTTPDETELKATIGSTQCLLRFKLVDLWAMQLLHMHKENIKDFSRVKIESILNQIKELQKKLEKDIESDPLKVFPTDESKYIGIFISERVAKKKFLSKGTYGLRYYCEENKKINN
jgi:hypothetical protein